MLNLQLVDDLYNGLSKDRQKALIDKLFKKSKQTMSYFHRTKDISMSKLEVLADFFHLPMDYFRADADIKYNTIKDSEVNIVLGNNNAVNTNLMKENEGLRNQIKTLNDLVKAKDESLKAKDEAIATKDAFIISLQTLLNPNTKE